jgi:glycosyltransferase involved in cell wall biosynthesis
MALRKHPTLQLVVGGHGQLEKARRLAAELGVDGRVDFRGWVGPEERSALLTKSDIYVLPSFNEGLPISVLEAMAAGLPVITTDVGGLPDLVTHGESGLLIGPGRVAALAAAILRLASDPESRQQMGEAAREHVAARYNREAVLNLLSSVYADVADRSPRSQKL